MITSRSNETVKQIIKLKQKKYRDESNLFIVEGKKLLQECVKANYEIQTLVKLEDENFVIDNAKELIVNKSVMEAISTFISIPSVIGIVKKKEIHTFITDKSCVILDNLQDPANVGAVIRTALGANIGAVYLINCADVYDMKTIRASMGSIFHISCQNVTTEFIALNFINRLICASQEGENIFKVRDLPKNAGLVIGNEGHGVSNELRNCVIRTVSIPMNKKLESLNASVSAGIIMYQMSEIKGE